MLFRVTGFVEPLESSQTLPFAQSHKRRLTWAAHLNSAETASDHIVTRLSRQVAPELGPPVSFNAARRAPSRSGEKQKWRFLLTASSQEKWRASCLIRRSSRDRRSKMKAARRVSL
jgi:hypothetical protein